MTAQTILKVKMDNAFIQANLSRGQDHCLESLN